MKNNNHLAQAAALLHIAESLDQIPLRLEDTDSFTRKRG